MFSAIIPVRKNKPQIEIMACNAKTLLERKINYLKNINKIQEIILASDDEEMEDYARKYDIKFYLRNEQESQDKVAQMVKNISSYAVNEYIIWTPCTTPFFNQPLLQECIDEYSRLDLDIYDSLITCIPLQGFILDENGALNFKIGNKINNSRNLSKLYLIINGCFIMSRELNMLYESQWGKIPFKKIIDKNASFEIKDQDGFLFFKNILDRRSEI